MQIPEPVRACAGTGADRALRLEEQAVLLLSLELRSQMLVRLEEEIHAGMIDQIRAHAGERHPDLDSECAQVLRGPNAASHQDRWRAIGSRGDHDDAGVQLAVLTSDAGYRANRSTTVEEHAVDQGVCHQLEVGPSPGGIEVRERGAPAHCIGRVDWDRCHPLGRVEVVWRVEAGDAQPDRCLERTAMPGRELVRGWLASTKPDLRSAQVRLK